jgi:hypothetical protein
MDPVKDIEIYGVVTISSEWLEITPTEMLKPERDVSVLFLQVSSPYALDFEKNGIRLPDSSVAIPEVKLIDQDKKEYDLRVIYMGETGIGFERASIDLHPIGLPKDKVFPKVRIRCSKPVECSKIIWRNYNPRDMK